VVAFTGLIFSLQVVVFFLIPQIISGVNIILITLVTGILIMTTALLLSHGINRRSFLALISSVFAIFVSTFLSVGGVWLLQLTGAGTETTQSLEIDKLFSNINLQGLLLGGIILGSLGVLDDITVSQIATVEELNDANPKISSKQLFIKSFSIGRSHIISVVNTLGLAYTGSALPVILLFSTLSPDPLWVNLNSEELLEEIIRTIIGTVGLLFAMPISTYLAVKFVKKKDKKSLV
jgi:uncharacterized membrane protein